MDNRYSPKIAQRNADVLVREKVDLVIEFQTDEHVAPIVAAKYREANIPLIAIEIPHPGATYFGANNYEAGPHRRPISRPLGQATWQSNVDEIVLITLERAGGLPKMRLTGMLVGMRRRAPRSSNVARDLYRRRRQDGRTPSKPFGGTCAPARRVACWSARSMIRAHLARSAFQEAGRTEGAPSWGRTRRPRAARNSASRGPGSSDPSRTFPEKYGAEIVAVAMDILHRRPVPPAVFVKHQLVTPENVNHVYPNDELIQLPVSGPSSSQIGRR